MENQPEKMTREEWRAFVRQRRVAGKSERYDPVIELLEQFTERLSCIETLIKDRFPAVPEKHALRERLLPRAEWLYEVEVNPEGKLFLLLGCWAKGMTYQFQRIAFSDLPQNLTCLDDLESFVVHLIHRQTA